MNRQNSKKLNPLVNQIFPDQDLNHRYKVQKIIGKGQYGYVAKAYRKKDKQLVAIKKLVNIFHNQHQTKRILREIILLKNCEHPNIISLIEISIPKSQNLNNFHQLYIVTEYCDTDLRKLFKLQETFLNISDVKYIFYQIACGIKYLHSASIIHRDLTPNNILINGQGMKIKICDLGLARIIDQKYQNFQLQNVDNSSDQDLSSEFIDDIRKSNQSSNDWENTNNQKQFSVQNSHKKQFDSQSQKIQNEVTKNQSSKQEQSFSSKISEPQANTQQQSKLNKRKNKLGRMNSIRNSQNNSIYQKIKSQEQKNAEFKAQKLNTMKNPLAKLTLRVTTRWYRAPEVILLQKGYSKPIDIWSLGCLFGELLKMMKSVCFNALKRFPLFPGKYCYPVSPESLNNINKEAIKMEITNCQNDQLFMILSTIGKPSEKQMDYLTDEKAKQYLRAMLNLERKQFKKFFPTVQLQAIEILEKTLLFDPRERISIQEILNHPFLSSIKNKQLEKQATPIIMKFQEEKNLTIEILKKYLVEEITHFF